MLSIMMCVISTAQSVYDCTFDSKSLCQWTNDPTGKINFTLKSGSTSSVYTGPSSDHTTGTNLGRCVYKHPRFSYSD